MENLSRNDGLWSKNREKIRLLDSERDFSDAQTSGVFVCSNGFLPRAWCGEHYCGIAYVWQNCYVVYVPRVNIGVAGRGCVGGYPVFCGVVFVFLS